jgi:hypothetical protein
MTLHDEIARATIAVQHDRLAHALNAIRPNILDPSRKQFDMAIKKLVHVLRDSDGFDQCAFTSTVYNA